MKLPINFANDIKSDQSNPQKFGITHEYDWLKIMLTTGEELIFTDCEYEDGPNYIFVYTENRAFTSLIYKKYVMYTQWRRKDEKDTD